MSWYNFCEDYNIRIADEDDHHYREGWINTSCPFCGDHSTHLGIPEGGFISNCYRCGKHHMVATISALLGVSKKKAHSIFLIYADSSFSVSRDVEEDLSDPVEMPETIPLTKHHRQYLLNRDQPFDPDELSEEWGISSFPPISGKYSSRIAIPVYFKGHLVTWQAMSSVRPSDKKYIFPSRKKEGTRDPHNYLYGFDKALESPVVFVTEGVTDVWRLGGGAVATFGTSWSEEQLGLLLSHWSIFIVCYDYDGNRSTDKQRKKLIKNLQFGGGSVYNMVMGQYSDIAAVPQKEANNLKRQFLDEVL